MTQWRWKITHPVKMCLKIHGVVCLYCPIDASNSFIRKNLYIGAWNRELLYDIFCDWLKIERFGEAFVHFFYILNFPNVHITEFLWTRGLWTICWNSLSLSQFKHLFTEVYLFIHSWIYETVFYVNDLFCV